MNTYASIIGGSLALAAATLPLSASAIPIRAVPQPAGANCGAVKIASKNTGNYWATIDCDNGLAYTIRDGSVRITLLLPAGGVAEASEDIDQTGAAVGVVYNAAGKELPYRWTNTGVPYALPNPGEAVAYGISRTGNGIVGNGVNPSGFYQALWFKPGRPYWIPPFNLPYSIAYDVSVGGVYVGQSNGVAAAGTAPGNLNPLPGLPFNSVAFQIMDKNMLVGYQPTGGPCGTGVTSTGFTFSYPAGPVNIIPPLGSDCAATFEDINDNYGIVGNSGKNVPGGVRATALNVPGFPPGYIDLNSLGGPWVHLTDASGIDDRNDVLATDGGASPTQVYIIN